MRLLRDRDGDIPVEARHAVFRYSPARATLLAGAGAVAILTLVWAGWSRGVNLRMLYAFDLTAARDFVDGLRR